MLNGNGFLKQIHKVEHKNWFYVQGDQQLAFARDITTLRV
jgi:hypothetical protein